MNASQLVIKCFAKKTEGVWVAVCLDFCLAVQGDSFEDVKCKLEGQISTYVTEALQDKEHGGQLLTRRAPLSYWIEYYFIRLTNVICHKASVIFDETMPLRPA